MSITTTKATFLAALFGAFLFEFLKAFNAWRADNKKLPSAAELVASFVMIVLGGLVPLVYGVEKRNFLEVAQLGLSVPGLITGGFRVGKDNNVKLAPGSARSLSDYVAWRL